VRFGSLPRRRPFCRDQARGPGGDRGCAVAAGQGSGQGWQLGVMVWLSGDRSWRQRILALFAGAFWEWSGCRQAIRRLFGGRGMGVMGCWCRPGSACARARAGSALPWSLAFSSEDRRRDVRQRLCLWLSAGGLVDDLGCSHSSSCGCHRRGQIRRAAALHATLSAIAPGIPEHRGHDGVFLPSFSCGCLSPSCPLRALLAASFLDASMSAHWLMPR